MATSAARLRELDSTLAVVGMALLIALAFQAQLFAFRRHHAHEPRTMVLVMTMLAAAFAIGETAALLGMLANHPNLATQISATGLVLIFALVLTLLFEQWLEGMREHARERHHERYDKAAQRAVDWVQWAMAGASAVAIAAIWWWPLG